MCIEMIKSFLCCKIFQGRSSETCGSQLVMTKISYILIGKRLSLFIFGLLSISNMYYYPDNDICKTQNAETLQVQQVIFNVPFLALFLDVITGFLANR